MFHTERPAQVPVIHQAVELTGSNTAPADEFGGSVAVSGTRIVVGASFHAGMAGEVYVFTKYPGGWRQSGQLVDPDTGTPDTFGDSVALSGFTPVV